MFLIKEDYIESKIIDNLNLYMLSKTFDIYNCINCYYKWTIDDIPIKPGTSKYEIRCPNCMSHQCCNCSILWENHDNIYCKNNINIDHETKIYLDNNTVICPGTCGMNLQKENDEEYCNVIRCYKCSIYVCALCGMMLDSNNFSLVDTAHVLASQHYVTGPLKCRNHLWSNRKEWFKNNTNE